MEMHHSNARLSIYIMGDVSAFMIKEDCTPIYGMGDTPALMIKGDAALETPVSLTCVIGDVH
jgi:hypothetical protein